LFFLVVALQLRFRTCGNQNLINMSTLFKKISCYIMTRVWLKFSQLVHLSYLFNLLHCNQGFGLLAIEISLTYPPLFFGSYITTKVLDHQWSRFNGVSMFFFQLLHYDQGFGLLVTKIQSCPPMCFKVIALQLGF
jgi:hypothetical protein